MKLLIITQKVDKNDPILGFFHRWIEEFSKHFERVTVICLERGEAKLPENVTALSLGKETRPSRIRYVVRLYSYIWRLRNSYDAVLVHMNPIYLVLCGMAWRLMGKRIFLWYTHKSVDWKLRLGSLFAEKIFSASDKSFRLETRKLRVMGHGIDTEIFAPRNVPKKFDLLFNSRVSPTKELGFLIEDIARLKEDGRRASLAVAGVPVSAEDFDYQKRVKEEIVSRGLSEQVTWLGAVRPSEMPELLSSVSILVNRSKTGSLDKVVLEAMSVGAIPLSSNEALHPLLDQWNLCLEDREAFYIRLGELLEGIGLPDPTRLREIVSQEHSLGDLIARLSELMKNS